MLKTTGRVIAYARALQKHADPPIAACDCALTRVIGLTQLHLKCATGRYIDCNHALMNGLWECLVPSVP
jgi:hypothetical protein